MPIPDVRRRANNPRASQLDLNMKKPAHRRGLGAGYIDTYYYLSMRSSCLSRRGAAARLGQTGGVGGPRRQAMPTPPTVRTGGVLADARTYLGKVLEGPRDVERRWRSR